MAAIPDTFDKLFGAMGNKTGIPMEIWKTLAWTESSLNPKAKGKAGDRGLFQITPVLRRDAAQSGLGPYSGGDMDDPVKNATVAMWFLTKRILPTYASVKGFPKMSWTSPIFVELVFLGYRGGYNGVAKTVKMMLDKGISVDSIEKVIEAAGILNPESKILVDPSKIDPKTKRGPYLSDPNVLSNVKLRWATYLGLATGDHRPKAHEPVAKAPAIVAAPQGVTHTDIEAAAERVMKRHEQRASMFFGAMAVAAILGGVTAAIGAKKKR